ncbi:hypothetical protein WOLCODRAFT_136054 [Wolfiporia cocos MD-104 SS10]|uniref:Uncharacterized protein n=1 Tax=Wolfiporia cocos (strain MD-104) TaxID=742152 RepID=A0A2H3JE80_WOLCO|nr:hypothetical protein WOLCODRAFT_136054 [Wolfiporia cocos MD-104 SS10]
MDPWTRFLRIRTVAFFSIMLLSLVWCTLLCVEAFLRYDESDPSQRNLVLVLILVNSVAAVALPALILMRFNAKFEGVRLFFILIFLVGTAALFTVWNPTFMCYGTENVCRRIDLFILILSWVNPALLVIYSAGLVAISYWRVRHPESPVLTEKRQSELPIMSPPPESMRTSSGMFGAGLTIQSDRHNGVVPPLPSSYNQAVSEQGKRRSSQLIDDISPRSSARLSKSRPKWFF